MNALPLSLIATGNLLPSLMGRGTIAVRSRPGGQPLNSLKNKPRQIRVLGQFSNARLDVGRVDNDRIATAIGRLE
jgi:hypothetical protein